MNTHTHRWTVLLAWAVGMLIVWSLFVPRAVSATTFFLFAGVGLVVLIFTPMFLRERQPSESISAIVGKLEAERGDDRTKH